MAKTVQQLVQEQVAAKIAVGEELERAVAAVSAKAVELADAERAANLARRAALTAGWSEAELKSIGLAARPRPRKRSAPSRASIGEDTSGPSQ